MSESQTGPPNSNKKETKPLANLTRKEVQDFADESKRTSGSLKDSWTVI